MSDRNDRGAAEATRGGAAARPRPDLRPAEPRLSRRDLLRGAGVAGIGAIGVGLGACSQRPEDNLVETSTAPTTIQSGALMTGSVVGLLSGSAVAGATLRVAGFDSVETNSEGEFELRVPDRGEYGLRIGGDGIHTRETAVRLLSNIDTTITVLERDEGLPMQFFDQYARGAGTSKEGVLPRTPGATNRWNQPPRVIIYRSLIDAPKLVISDARLAAMQGAILALFGPLTGNALGPAPVIEVRRTAPPTSLGDVPGGVIVIGQRRDSLLGASHAGATTDRWAITKAIVFNGVESTLALFNRMFAHALGGYVVDGFPSILSPAGRDAATPRDLAAATMLYSRRAGNTSPDQDPDGTFLNA